VVADLLHRLGPGSAVLDAACGTGLDAAALARRGFRVRAADGSAAMVEIAAARFRREGLALPVRQCLWADLPDTIDERFDVVLCTGNALAQLFEDGDRIEPHEYRISLLPVALAELRERVELAGLREVGTDFSATTDQYFLLAVAA
jgi:SAM-dependent methyltransferase